MNETILNVERFDPPERLLCGPGPSNVAPAVLAAMRRPMLGHLDPCLHDLLLEVIDLLRATYRASEGLGPAVAGHRELGDGDRDREPARAG